MNDSLSAAIRLQLRRFVNPDFLATPWPTVGVVVVGTVLSLIGRYTRMSVFSPDTFGDVGTWAAGAATVSAVSLALRGEKLTARSLDIQIASLAAPVQAEAIRYLSESSRNLVRALSVFDEAEPDDSALPEHLAKGISEPVSAAIERLLDARSILRLLDPTLAAETTSIDDDIRKSTEVYGMSTEQILEARSVLDGAIDKIESLEERIAGLHLKRITTANV